MKKLFNWLFYWQTGNEQKRPRVFNALHARIADDYNEQTVYGNLANANIEFLMSNDLLVKAVHDSNNDDIGLCKKILDDSFRSAVTFIKKEQLTGLKIKK